jgi:hypothetical protein
MFKYLVMIYTIETNNGGFEGESIEEIIAVIVHDCISKDWTPDIKDIFCDGEEVDYNISEIQKQVDDEIDYIKYEGGIDHEGKDMNYFDQKRLDL